MERQPRLQRLTRGQKRSEIPEKEPFSSADPILLQYEMLKGFVVELSRFATTLGLTKICSKETCPIMEATEEWQYLCAAHKQPQECSAIDYISHTLAGTCALLNSNRWFPSQQTALSPPPSSAKFFQSCARRLIRLFSHCFFHHKDVFMKPRERLLYTRFMAFIKEYSLVPEDSPEMLLIPPEALLPVDG